MKKRRRRCGDAKCNMKPSPVARTAKLNITSIPFVCNVNRIGVINAFTRFKACFKVQKIRERTRRRGERERRKRFE